MQWYMDYVCNHVPHLDLVDIGQTMSATVRLMVTSNPVKKISNQLMLQSRNPYILKNVPCFCFGKILKRHLLVGKKVLYKFLNDIASNLLNRHAVN